MFRDLGIAVSRFREYPVFMSYRKRRIIGFGLLIVLLYFLLTVVVPIVKFQVITGGVGQIMEDYVPDFELKEGTLWVAEKVEFDYDNVLLWVDTSPGAKLPGTDAVFLSSYDQAVLMNSETMILKNNNEISQFSFSNMDGVITRDSAANYLSKFTTVIGAVVVLIIFLWMIFALFFGALVVSLIGMIVASCTRTALAFGEIYSMAVYSRVLPLLIKALLSLLPFSIPFFTILNYGISVLILYLAFQAVKTNMRSAGGPPTFQVDENGRYLTAGEQDTYGWKQDQGNDNLI